MLVANDKVVSVHFKVKNNEHEILDETSESEPLEYIQGSGLLIEALEQAMLGRKVADRFSLELTADQAYGERFEELCQAMPKEVFEGIDVEVGMHFHAETDEGDQTVTVVAIEGDNIVVDGNHPLAGMDLVFDVEVVGVRDATEEELSHGHLHMDGHSCGHDH